MQRLLALRFAIIKRNYVCPRHRPVRCQEYRVVLRALRREVASPVQMPTQSFGVKHTPFYHVPHTFDEETFELQLPEFMQEHEAMPISLFDFKETVRLSNRRGAKGNKARWLAELHLFYYNFPQLCRACLCNAPCNCPNYSALWDRFLQATDTAMPNKRHLPAVLKQWHLWAQEQMAAGLLSRHQVEICYGPHHSLRHFDRARVGSAVLASKRLEGAKKASDSIVMSQDGTQLIAGRVRAFLSHSAPGCDPDPEHEANIADVECFAPVPNTHAAAQKSMQVLGCPIFKRHTPDHRNGNLWPVEKVFPCKLAALPHHSGNNHLVILSRFQSFMSHTTVSVTV